jgi:hypothetical protein
MPADYLSRMPSSNPNQISKMTDCFDPFQLDLLKLQKADESLQNMNYLQINGQWPPNLAKSEAKYLQNLAVNLYQDANNIIWMRLDELQRTALYLPENQKIITKWHC